MVGLLVACFCCYCISVWRDSCLLLYSLVLQGENMHVFERVLRSVPLIVFTSFTGENMHVFERVLRSVVGVHGFRWVHCVISVQLL